MATKTPGLKFQNAESKISCWLHTLWNIPPSVFFSSHSATYKTKQNTSTAKYSSNKNQLLRKTIHSIRDGCSFTTAFFLMASRGWYLWLEKDSSPLEVYGIMSLSPDLNKHFPLSLWPHSLISGPSNHPFSPTYPIQGRWGPLPDVNGQTSQVYCGDSYWVVLNGT